MKLYFFRHGHAEDAQGPEFDDFTRNLTSKGIGRTEAAGKALVKLGVKPKYLYASPRARARQTADILAKALDVKVSVREEVNFGFNSQHVQSMIAELEAIDEIMFVGHEPDLSITVSSLVGGGEILMKKGGMARVDVSPQSALTGVLVWMMAPRLFESIAGG